MTGIEEHLDDDGLRGRLVDHVLGEETAEEREQTRAEIAADVDLAVECGELRTLLDSMRSLSVEPSGGVELAVRYAVERRQRLRREPMSAGRRAVWIGQIASIAAAVLFSFVLVDRFAHQVVDESAKRRVHSAGVAQAGRVPPQRDEELVRLLATSNVPVGDPEFRRSLERFEALTVPESFAGWLSASDELKSLRDQFRLRFAREERRRMLRSIGSPNLDDRLDALSSTIADRMDTHSASAGELSLVLRSMLASGSSRVSGPHSELVHSCAVELVNRMPELETGEVASALAALADLAVVEGGRLVDVVAYYAEAMARDTLSSASSQRPALLHWRTAANELADAGRVLRISPAFGVHAGLAFRARMMIAAHLDERLRMEAEVEAPSLIAAQLYGFGDLIDRDEADRALRLWNPKLLVPNYVALHHLAWSKLPERPGWARFQQQLRGLSSLSTPVGTRDAAALLLCLTMNYAAPGVLLVAKHD